MSAPAPATVTAPAPGQAVVSGRDLIKRFPLGKRETITALNGVSLEARAGTLTALVGPDGAGKTTLLRLIAGLLTADAGDLHVLGIDARHNPEAIQARLGYMPQRFGLYEDLTVRENLDLYADLHGVTPAERAERQPRLMAMTQLGPFLDRLAGRLSGGMKQKLGLACTLVRAPDLLLLDEPTVGVDPLSRRELWEIITQLVREHGLTVLMSTSYLNEAENGQHVVVLHQGRVLTQGPPQAICQTVAGQTFLADPGANESARGVQARLFNRPEVIDAVPEAGRIRLVLQPGITALTDLPHLVLEPTAPNFEDAFMTLLRQVDQQPPAANAANAAATAANAAAAPAAPAAPATHGHALTLERSPVSREATHAEGGTQAPVVEVRDLVRKFGTFVAVDHVSFNVRAGEIVGLLGPNGAGKTTTFRMLCGLLPATSGTLRVAGLDLHHARDSARQRIGYVAQKFSLYGQLSVRENLDFFASAYGLRGARKRARIDWATRQFDLAGHATITSGELPGGYKQRLAMAAALLHEPEILFLDEPTSGADPLARREFWRRITALAEQSVTVIVTTHFMGEAEYCDRIVILDAGKVLAHGTPAEIRGTRPNMDEAFIAIVEAARTAATATAAPTATAGTALAGGRP